MPFESLSERFQAAFKKLRGKGKLSEEDVSEALKPTLTLPLRKILSSAYGKKP